ncbi:MAG: 2OG-Fe(II) oxygenase family protein [Pseudomonadales bacterium]
MNLTTVDFSRLDQTAERHKLDQACREHGCFALANHGINTTVQRRFVAAQQHYFQQPLAAKLQQERSATNPFGFYNKELTKNQLDRKEVFDISLSETTLWPEDVEFQAATSAWFKACHEVGIKLLENIFSCLETTLPVAAFQSHSSFLRLNYYPAYAAEAGSDPAFGVSHHTDAGALTLLMQDQVPGLQFLLEGGWHTAPAVPEVLLVNLGDMLQVWSNDTYQAPLHRVLTNANEDRYSAPYFLNPAYHCDIKPLIGGSPVYRTVNWQEFRSGRAAGDYADLGEEIQISQYRLRP